MAVPPKFRDLEEAAGFVMDHASISHFMTARQVAAFVKYLYTWSDGSTPASVITTEFYRLEIARLDAVIRGDEDDES